MRDPSGQWEEIPETKRYDEFVTIDWVEDEIINHKNSLQRQKQMKYNNKLRYTVISFAQNWFVLAAIGVTIGLIAAFLNIITAWLASVRLGYCSKGFYLNRSFCCWGQDEATCTNWNSWTGLEIINYFAYIIVSVAFSFVAAYLVKCYSASAAGSGISEIKCIVSGFNMKGFLGWWTLLIKSLALPLAISSGLSVGKEGPSVHYAVCVGNSITKLFSKYKKSASRAREFLTASAAAGVAVAFGSPMGGVLFAMEEISSVFQLSTIVKSYFCALVAVTTLAAVNPFRTGQLVMFEVSYDTNWHYFEMPIYVLLGAFGGFYGIIVSKLNIRVVSFRKRYLANFAIREVFILTLFTAIICFHNEFLRLDMTETMQILFRECDANFNHSICSKDSKKAKLFVSLIFATIMRLLFTIISYGCKVPAGIFVPSMAAGATFGRAIGIVVDSFYQNHPKSGLFATCTDGKCIIPGTYAFLGAAAALCGITDLTVTVVVIMFELTGALRYIIPTMVVVAVTKMINDKWGKGGIADQMIVFNGLPLIDPKEEFHFNTGVTSAMATDTVSLLIKSDITVSQLKGILEKTDYRGFPLIESDYSPRIVGYISRLDILHALASGGWDNDTLCKFSRDFDISGLDLSAIVNPCPLQVSSSTTLEYVLDIFAKLGPRYLLVEENGLLAGIVTRKDVLRYEHSSHEATDERARVAAFETKVWELMMLVGTNIKKNCGKLLYNDALRFL